MGGIYGCVWLVGVVVGRYIDFLMLLIPTPLVSALFCSSIPTFCSFLQMFSFLYKLLIYTFKEFPISFSELYTYLHV